MTQHRRAVSQVKPKRMPRDDHGRFVPLACPVAECYGKLELQDPKHGIWECDGLIPADDSDPTSELICCTYGHYDGDEIKP